MANNRIAYGLANEYNINTKGMTPHQVWEALSEKGISVQGEHKKNAKKSIEELKELAKVPLDYFGKKGHKQPDVSTEIPPVPKEAFGFDKKRLNTNHHKRHKLDMNYKDEKTYNQAAMDFWNKGDGELYYSERRGNFCKIGRDGVTVCFCSAEGIIGSFYRYSNKAETRQFVILERLIKI